MPYTREENTYNVFNQLVSTKTEDGTTADYIYYPNNLRLSKQVTKNNNTTYTGFMWDGSQTVAEFDVGFNLTNTYMFGRKQKRIMGTNLNTNVKTCYVYNAHGDVEALANASGTVTKTYRYDAFGNEMNKVDADTNPWRYCGEYDDTETDNIYLRNRYYNPSIGRFINEDTHWNTDNMIYGDKPEYYEYTNYLKDKHIKKFIPSTEAIFQSNNLYVYSINNPCDYKDINGFFTIGVGGDFAAALGIKISADAQLVVDDDGNVGILVCGGVGGGFPAMGLSGSRTITNADTIFDLEGLGGDVGISGNIEVLPISVGVDGMIGRTKDDTPVYGVTCTVGAKASLPVEVHGTVTYTRVWGFNSPKVAEKITKSIIKLIGESAWEKLCSAQEEVKKKNEQKKNEKKHK